MTGDQQGPPRRSSPPSPLLTLMRVSLMNRMTRALCNALVVLTNSAAVQFHTHVQSKLQHATGEGDASIPSPLHTTPAPTRLFETTDRTSVSTGVPGRAASETGRPLIVRSL